MFGVSLVGPTSLMIYLDVTILCEFLEANRSVTGIQRVTLELAIGLIRILGVKKVELLRYERRGKRLSCAPITGFSEVFSTAPGDVLNNFRNLMAALQWRPFAAEFGSILLLSEGLCDRSRYTLFAKAKHNYKLTVAQIIYDVVPLAASKYCDVSNIVAFRRVLPDALSLADQVVTISDSSKSEMLRLADHLLLSQTPIKVWKLPHEFTTPASSDFSLPRGVRPKFVLCSGTIEIRKNQHLVVSAWRKLAAKHGEKMPQLVLVGKYGHITRETLGMRAYLWRNNGSSGEVIVFNRCKDTELRTLYDHCLFSIYVSNYEGWGLPIGESLWCGRPVLSGTSTSLPEVGGDLVDYVDPNDQMALMAAIEKLCFDAEHRERRVSNISNAKLRRWDDAIKEFAQIITMT
jgi:glycosyltransferase involved in cell wall biosynthesis